MDKVKHIVQFSGGKDSTCMLLMMLEKGMQVDEIIFCDTGMEFPQMYEHIDKVEQYIGRKITRLKAKNSFEYMMFEWVRTKGKRIGEKGYGWPTMQNRWCTQHFKISLSDRYYKAQKNILKYIGIAADEPKRHMNIPANVKHPLFDWGITEKMALQTCYKHGFTWGGCTINSGEFPVGVALCNLYQDCESCITIFLNYGNSLKLWIKSRLNFLGVILSFVNFVQIIAYRI